MEMAQRKSSNKEIHPNDAGVGNAADLTIDDIARVAGVSVSTVSRILNDKPDVAVATRQRVKQVMDDLGYSPHTLAQRLAVRRSRSIALIFPLGDTAGRAEVATFIVKAAFAAESENYLFSLVAAPTTENRLLNLYRSAQVEGVILMEVRMHDWRVELLKKYDYPFVMIGRSADNTGLSFIDLDFEAAIVLAVDHLVQLGHQRIGFFNSSVLCQDGYGPAVRSALGYERARENYPIELLPFGMEDTDEAVAAVFRSKVSAVVMGTHSELSLPDFFRGVQRHGCRVPEDISIVCLQSDDIAKNLIRPMTSITFDIHTAADWATKALINQLEGRSTEVEQIVLPPQLIVRESTMPRS
jgi:DNA-binding LacI/PurR family transcriptional regulator